MLHFPQSDGKPHQMGSLSRTCAELPSSSRLARRSHAKIILYSFKGHLTMVMQSGWNQIIIDLSKIRQRFYLAKSPKRKAWIALEKHNTLKDTKNIFVFFLQQQTQQHWLL